MTISKILATSAIVGLMCGAAFANEINFSQSGGSVTVLTFHQHGASNMISSDGTAITSPATVEGSLDTLTLEQIGSNNIGSFAITTDGASTGDVSIMMKGSTNTSSLTVTQGLGDTLAFSVGVEGNNNSVSANITADTSLVNIESTGNNVAFTISQTGAVTAPVSAYDHSIIAHFGKSGIGVATVDIAQSGLSNSILMGTPSDYGLFTGSGGMTLLGGATVSITQSADLATYTATQSVADGGYVTVVQSN